MQQYRTKILASIPILIVVFFIGKWVYSYFTFEQTPRVLLCGITDQGYYKGTVDCILRGDNGYKISEIELLLDGKAFDFGRKKSVRRACFDIPFKVESTSLEDGMHVFQILAKDGSYRSNTGMTQCAFYVDNSPLSVSFLDTDYAVSQGRTIHAKIVANKKLKQVKADLFGATYFFYPESDGSKVYECFIPVDCEQHTGQHVIEASVEDNVGTILKLSANVKITPFNFPKAKRFHVSAEKLEEEKEVSMSARILEDALERWVAESPKEKMWVGNFVMPCEVQRISTEFGELRMTTQKGRYYHKAIDIVNHPKSVVWAGQRGKVIIKDRYLMSGNTVVLDHGIGIFSMYFHLNDFADIEVGDMLKKGAPVGTVGSTGYATAAHLHWEIRVNNMAVDPLQWVEKTF